MTTQKRRVVYFTDEDWAELGERSAARGVSRSAYLRAATVGPNPYVGRVEREPLTVTERRYLEFRPAPKPTKGK